jgi:4-hydroxy-tetrahydrodipicolinate synthase
MTGFKLSVDLLRRLRDAFPETVVGVKNSSGDWSAMEATLSALPGFNVFAGSEQFLLQTLRAGGPGCISATANVTAPALGELYANWGASEADTLQGKVTRTRLALQAFPTIPALKEIIAVTRGLPSWRRLRPPFVNLSADETARLHAAAREAGLL